MAANGTGQRSTVESPERQVWRLDWRARHWLTLLVFLPLSLIVALRGDTGDTANYLDAFKATQDFPWDPLLYYGSFSMEWSFGVLSWLINALSLPSPVLFFVYSFATFYFLSLAASRMELSLVAIAPYYLGTFFLAQQFLQIRQGLAMGLAFSLLPLVVARRKGFTPVLSLAATSMVHVVSCLTLVTGWVLSFVRPKPTRRALTLWSLALIVLTFLFARAVMTLDVISTVGRLADYAADGQYNQELQLLAPPNIRAALLMVMMLLAVTPRLQRSPVFVVLIGMYAVHVGMRFGFYDFVILSGRLSTALSFAEVFILPLLVREHVCRGWLRGVLAGLYLLVHAVATYQVQVPTLFDDYFTPL
ncbi:MAG: EpsG family protein [Roseateles sp.]|nr:MAG: EpsG family protein [Roseateles sp.]